jgi:hypothetical protein
MRMSCGNRTKTASTTEPAMKADTDNDGKLR